MRNVALVSVVRKIVPVVVQSAACLEMFVLAVLAVALMIRSVHVVLRETYTAVVNVRLAQMTVEIVVKQRGHIQMSVWRNIAAVRNSLMISLLTVKKVHHHLTTILVSVERIETVMEIVAMAVVIVIALRRW